MKEWRIVDPQEAMSIYLADSSHSATDILVLNTKDRAVTTLATAAVRDIAQDSIVILTSINKSSIEDKSHPVDLIDRVASNKPSKPAAKKPNAKAPAKKHTDDSPVVTDILARINLLVKNGYNLKDIAKECGIPYTSFYTVYIGKTKKPRQSTLDLIAKGLDKIETGMKSTEEPIKKEPASAPPASADEKLPKKCKGCIYYKNLAGGMACHFAIDTGQLRGMPAELCNLKRTH